MTWRYHADRHRGGVARLLRIWHRIGIAGLRCPAILDRGQGGADHGPSLKSTVAAALTPAFIAGMVLDLVGFAGSLVSARLIPLFLSQTIMSANLVVTAVLGIAVLGVRLQRRDWLAICGSCCRCVF